MTDVFHQQLETVRQRLAEIEQSVYEALRITQGTEASHQVQSKAASVENSQRIASTLPSLLLQTLSVLSSSLEELQTAAEELSYRNEEWLAICQAAGTSPQLQFAPDALIVTNKSGIILKANGAAAALLNIRQDFLIGKPLILYFAAAERPQIRALLNQLAQSSPENLSLDERLQDWETRLQPRQENLVTVVIAVSRICRFQEVVGMRWRFRDITQKKQLEAELLHQALYDSLTTLPNRTLLFNRLSHALQLFKRYPERLFAVLFIDVNDFKQINDSFGHLIGDEILVKTAARLTQCVRVADTAARLGGDEFVILLEEIGSYQDAEHCANRILQASKVPMTVDERQFVVCLSIGIALSSPAHQHPQDILQEADAAMYQAKQERADYKIFVT